MTRTYVAVTTCNRDQWENHGREMALTFCRHWPENVPLWLYAEGFGAAPEPGSRVRLLDLEKSSSWLAAFKRNAVAAHRGRANGGSYDFRRDAVRFAHKIATIDAAAQEVECNVLIWIDADTVTHAPVSLEWLEELFPKPAALAWLDRANRIYPECGFLMFRLPHAREVIGRIVAQYTSGSLFGLPETHDSYVIQHVVEHAVRHKGFKVASLSGQRGRQCIGHPWVNSPLAARMDHLKGARKELGHSRKGDIVHPRDEPYWRAIQGGDGP